MCRTRSTTNVDGFVNRFENDNSISISKNNLIYFNDIPWDDIYEIVMSSSNTNDSSMFAVRNKSAKLNLDSALLWHCHLGNINKKCIEKLQLNGLLDSTDIKSFEKYVACMFGKMARKPYSHQVEKAKELLGLIQTNICGPFKIMSRQGAYYFVTFTDDFSRYGYVYLLKHKHEVFETFKVFQKEVESQLGKTIKSLRSDHGGEYISQEFLDHLKDHGIIAHRTPPYMPQHNGVSKRRNQKLLDMVRSMMSQTTLPKSFWDYVFESSTRILNIVPTKKIDKKPYKVWHGQAPKLSYLKVWGCEALVKHDTLTKPDKLEPRAFKCIFVGYPKEMIGYSFYYPPENKVFVSWNAKFFKNDVIDHEANGIDAEEHELRDLGEPANYKAALLDLESDKWLNAMYVEMQSMKDNKVWELVDLPPDRKTVDIRAIRILIAMAMFYDHKIWQMDVKTAFLNGYLNEETAVKNILKYLRNTKDMFLVYGGVVDWKSTKQSIFATSSIDAEYIIAFDASKEAVWIPIAKDHGVTKGARHFRAKVYYLQETIEMGDVKIEKVDTNDNLADPFTKALVFPKHSELTEKIRMISASSRM
ncbi:retrotransposon protein, putative, ty1-copia subclass [Tanacetum coccineum]